MRFELVRKQGEARLGRLSLEHGEVDTPCFMPVATQGAVKGLTVEDLEQAGASMMLSNLYHDHGMSEHDFQLRHRVERDSEDLPRIICSEAFV